MAQLLEAIPNVAHAIDGLDVERLRHAIQEEYSLVATEPEIGFQFHTGRLLSFEIAWRGDVFSGAPQASSAAKFGTLGINFRARKPTTEDEWLRAVSSLVCRV